MLARYNARRGRHTAEICHDVSKAYERVRSKNLIQLGTRTGYPSALPRMSIRSYRRKRVISDGRICTES